MKRDKRKIRRKEHKTTILRELIGSDLLTYKEKLYEGKSSGMFKFTDEQAYCKLSSDEEELSLAALGRKLYELSPYFRIVKNNKLSTNDHTIEGHSLYFIVPWMDGIIHCFNFGRNREDTVRAETQGWVANFTNTYQDDTVNITAKDQEAVFFRGWVATYEGAKEIVWKFENEGISLAMVYTEKDVYQMRESFSLIGFKDTFHNFVEAQKEAEIEANKLLLEETPKEEDVAKKETEGDVCAEA